MLEAQQIKRPSATRIEATAIPIMYVRAAEAISEGKKWLRNPATVAIPTTIPTTIRMTPSSIPKKLLPLLFNSMFPS